MFGLKNIVNVYSNVVADSKNVYTIK